MWFLVKMFPLKTLLFLLTCLQFGITVKPINVRIGIIGEFNDDFRQNNARFWSFANNQSSTVTFVPVVQSVQWWDSLQVSRKACSLFSQGVDGLVSFLPPNVSPVLSSYANTYGLPLILKTSAKTTKASKFSSEVKLIPSTERTVSSLLDFYKWKSFAFLYDSDIGPQLLQKVLERNPQLEVEAVWRVSNGEQAVRFLQMLENNADYHQQKKEFQNVLLATDNGLLDEALISLPLSFTIKYHLFSTQPVLLLQKRYLSTWHLVTRLALVDNNSTVYKALVNRWITIPHPYGNPTEPSSSAISAHSLLTYDAVGLLSRTFYNLVQQDDSFGRKPDDKYAVKADCSPNPERKNLERSTEGTLSSSYLKNAVFENGVTGRVKFDESGERTDFGLHIYETVSSVSKKVGEWSDLEGLQMSSGKTQIKPLKDQPPGTGGNGNPSRKPLNVTSVLVLPYLMKSKSPDAQGNDRFYGFAKDLMDEVSNILGVPYIMNIVKDGRYGTYDGLRWNGMIGEVVREEADVAVAPLTIARFREEVVDFTVPFMTLGLNILIKKPPILEGASAAKLTPFGFLSAFTYDTWLVLAAVYVFIGAGFFVVSHFTGAPDRIRSVDTKGSDQLSVCSSFWFAAGSLFFQNTGIYPRSLSHRVLSIVWWVFTLVTVFAYIGSLSSMLIKDRTKIKGAVDTYLTSFQLIKNFVETGYPAIGLVESGSTEKFFKSSEVGIYNQYGNYLEKNPGLLTKNYAEGIGRVRSSGGSYAFIMESTQSEYMSNHPPCDTVATSGYLDSRHYGMAVKKGSNLRESLNHAILTMMESGTVRQLYEKWWHANSECSNLALDILPGLYDGSLKINEVSGAFYILTIGIVCASVAAVIEYFIRSKKLPVDS